MVKLVANKIIVRDEKDLVELETRLARVQSQYLPFVIYTLKELIDEIIVTEIKERMRDKGFSESIIDKVRVEQQVIKQMKKLRFFVVSNYHSANGIPVADIMENGRRAYFVKPRFRDALRFFLSGIKQPNFVSIKGNVPVYSKGHQIPVMEAYKIVYNTVQKLTPKVKDEFAKRQKQWYRDSLRK